MLKYSRLKRYSKGDNSLLGGNSSSCYVAKYDGDTKNPLNMCTDFMCIVSFIDPTGGAMPKKEVIRCCELYGDIVCDAMNKYRISRKIIKKYKIGRQG